MASTMLLATRLSDAAKKPRLRLSMRRSSSVRPSFDFHNAMSACIETSVGIQWFLQPDRYFSHAQRYLSGKSWFTSARALIMRLSSTETRAPPRSISPRPVASASPSIAAGCFADAFVSAQLSIIFLLDRRLLAGFAFRVVDRARLAPRGIAIEGDRRGRSNRDRDRVELSVRALQRRLFDMRGRPRAQVV